MVDVVLIQTDMKELDAFEIARSVRLNKKIHLIPLIFVCNQEKCENLVQKAIKSGVTDVFYNPFIESVLIHKVQIYHDMIRNQRELENQIIKLKELNQQNLEMQKQIEKIASVDYLTEIANRRILDQELMKEYNFALQNQTPICLLMMDLDNFKMYNDYYGHQKGDKALQKIAKASKNTIKNEEGIVGRYGGEEFLFILKNCGVEKANKTAKKIIQNIEKLILKHNPLCDTELLTVSIGIISCIPTKNMTITKLIAGADEALYEAKRLGKNRSMLYKQ
jgi:diguanylate cyclase (GGDEF)-like protein